MRNVRITACVVVMSALATGSVMAGERDVQIRSINVGTGVVQLFNFGDADMALDAWQFCTHDEATSRNYSAPGGFAGRTIEAGSSLFVHYNNDSPGGPDHINIDQLGGFFSEPLDAGPYGMQIYFPIDGFVCFENGDQIADHLQWSIDGQDDRKLASGDTVSVCRSPHSARFVRFSDAQDYYARLAERLDWLRVIRASDQEELFELDGIPSAN